MPHLGLIDALEFARLGQVLEGGVPIDAFERLAPMLCDRAGELHYRLAGSVDARGAAALRLQ